MFIIALQAVAKAAGKGGVYIHSINLHLNIYTVPTMVMAVLTVVNFIIFIIYFQEDPSMTRNKADEEQEDIYGG